MYLPCARGGGGGKENFKMSLRLVTLKKEFKGEGKKHYQILLQGGKKKGTHKTYSSSPKVLKKNLDSYTFTELKVFERVNTKN